MRSRLAVMLGGVACALTSPLDDAGRAGGPSAAPSGTPQLSAYRFVQLPGMRAGYPDAGHAFLVQNRVRFASTVNRFLAPPRARLQRQLEGLVAAEGGPPGALMTLRRGSRTTVLTAGVAEVASGRKPRATDHMRIASMAKAFSSAVAFRLVDKGRLRLESTIGEVLPGLPRRWRAVSVRQMLDHTSGLPDYTETDAFRNHVGSRPRRFVSTKRIIGWVRDEPLVFRSGSDYRYSNTDNIVIGLMAQKVTGRPYVRLLRRFVFEPLRLRETSLPTTVALPRPFIHGYLLQAGSPPEDASELVNPSGAWASGGVVSTPREVGVFIRGLLGARLFPRELQRRQLRSCRAARPVLPVRAGTPPAWGCSVIGPAAARSTDTPGTIRATSSSWPPPETAAGPSPRR